MDETDILLSVAEIGVAAFRREKLRRHLPGFRKIASAIMFTMVATAFLGFAIVAALVEQSLKAHTLSQNKRASLGGSGVLAVEGVLCGGRSDTPCRQFLHTTQVTAIHELSTLR